jgi:hypothetical protein
MVGTWQGTRTNPWDPDATVVVHFDASRTYTAHCLTDCPDGVWHYGIDDDLPSKTYDVFTIDSAQAGEAHIEIAFDTTEALQGTLEGIAMDSAATTLSFDFYPTWDGTINAGHFTLTRTQ